MVLRVAGNGLETEAAEQDEQGTKEKDAVTHFGKNGAGCPG